MRYYNEFYNVLKIKNKNIKNNEVKYKMPFQKNNNKNNPQDEDISQTQLKKELQNKNKKLIKKIKDIFKNLKWRDISGNDDTQVNNKAIFEINCQA